MAARERVKDDTLRTMKLARVAAGVGVVLLVGLAARREPTAQTAPQSAGPPVVLLEGPPDVGATDVVLRFPGSRTAARTIGHIDHAEGSARRGALIARGTSLTALVVVAEHASVRGSTYDSALFRASEGTTSRLIGDVTNVSAPLVTETGRVLVQRGHDGTEPEPDGSHALRERVDALSVDEIDLATGAPRNVWSGAGQIAFLACALRGDEVLIYHVSPAGAELLVLDASIPHARRLAGPFEPLARDFSYDRVRDEVVFVRAAGRGAREYEIVRMPAHTEGSAPRVIYRGPSDHLMPHALADGTVGFSTPGEHGLALIVTAETAGVRPFARSGDGSDALLAESRDTQWLAVRHRDAAREALALVERTGGAVLTVSRPDVVVEFVGFAPGVAAAQVAQ